MTPEMSEMMGSFSQPLVRADLDEWADRIGRPSPTMFDALRFGSLEMRISAARERAQEQHVARGLFGGDFPSLGSIAEFFKKGPDGRRGSGFPPVVVEGFAMFLLSASASLGPAAVTPVLLPPVMLAGASSGPAAGTGANAQSAPAAGKGPARVAQSAPAAGAGPTMGVVTPPLSSVERKCHACARPASHECGRCRGAS
jgi:hypothetical protein